MRRLAMPAVFLAISMFCFTGAIYCATHYSNCKRFIKV